MAAVAAAAVPSWDYHGTIAELHVRNIPDELHDRLRERATTDGRSMSSEAVAILKHALLEGERSARHQAAVEQLREIRQRTRPTAEMPTAEDMVREDRDNAR